MNINIISQGGIGNQLFQAAAAHEIAVLYPDFHVNFLNANHAGDRPFKLHQFFSDCPHVSKSKTLEKITPVVKNLFYRNKRKKSLILKCLLTRLIHFEELTLNEQSISFITRIINNSPKKIVFLDGYFQSPDYVGADMECFNNLFQKYVNLHRSKNRINKGNYAVIHSRKGDYHENSSFGPLSLRYFLNAIQENLVEDMEIRLHSDSNQDQFQPIIKNLRVDLTNSFSTNPWDLIWDTMHSKYFFGSNSTLSFWASYALDLQSEFSSSASYFPDEWHVGVSTQKFEIYDKKWNLLKSNWHR